MYCRYCGCRLDETVTSCPNCGARVISSAEAREQPKPPAEPTQPRVVNVVNNYYCANTPGYNESDKSRGTALILCLLFGGFGIHRFYVGKIGTGILFLLTFGWCGIGCLVDLIAIICKEFKDKEGRRLR